MPYRFALLCQASAHLPSRKRQLIAGGTTVFAIAAMATDRAIAPTAFRNTIAPDRDTGGRKWTVNSVAAGDSAPGRHGDPWREIDRYGQWADGMSAPRGD